MWKRWIIVVACLALVTSRLRWPDAKVDTSTVWLLAIAALAFVMPELKALAPYIKRIKIGDTEIELVEQISRLGREVEKAQESVAKSPTAEWPASTTSEINEILLETSKDPRAALLLVAAKLEQQVRARIEEAGLAESKRFMSLSQIVNVGVSAGIFPQELMPAFRDFWTVRNRVAHGEAFEVESSNLFSLISLGTELLKMVSVKKTDG